MDDWITLDDLLQRQQEMAAVMQRLQGETDAQRVQALAAQLQGMGQELAGLAQKFQAQQQARAGTATVGVVQVGLLPAQRERVRAATGVDIEVLRVPDPTGAMSRSMPLTDPARIEALALEEARRRQAAAEAEAQARAQLRAALDDIDRHGGVAKERLDELRRDPGFLGGILQRG